MFLTATVRALKKRSAKGHVRSSSGRTPSMSPTFRPSSLAISAAEKSCPDSSWTRWR